MDDTIGKKPNEQIEEAELIDTSGTPPQELENTEFQEDPESTIADSQSESINSDVTNLLDIEKSIRMMISAIERYRDEMKPLKEMLESTLEADLEYAEISEAAKEAAKKKTAKKKELLNTPAGKDLTQKFNLVRDSYKEHQEKLSFLLQEYSRLTGAKEIEGDDGELRQIVYQAKLVRKTNLQRD